MQETVTKGPGAVLDPELYYSSIAKIMLYSERPQNLSSMQQ